MKKVNYLWIFVAFFAISSCGNNEQEKKIAELEGKLAALEASQTRPATPAAQQQPAEPEVKPEGPLPTIQWSEEEHDFGTITDGDIVEHTFKFQNTGEAPLIISNAKATCGCTVPQWPKEPIPVGEEGEITVRFNSRNKPGNQNKTITVTANTYPSANRVRIRANVLKAEGGE